MNNRNNIFNSKKKSLSSTTNQNYLNQFNLLNSTSSPIRSLGAPLNHVHVKNMMRQGYSTSFLNDQNYNSDSDEDDDDDGN